MGGSGLRDQGILRVCAAMAVRERKVSKSSPSAGERSVWERRGARIGSGCWEVVVGPLGEKSLCRVVATDGGLQWAQQGQGGEGMRTQG